MRARGRLSGGTVQYRPPLPHVGWNPVTAVEWWLKVAEQGFARAEVALGACYFDGLGVPKNQSEVVKWYRKAAAQGDATAKRALEEMGE